MKITIGAVLHPATERDLDMLSATPPHAVALVAPAGAGKGFVAQQFSKVILQHERELSSHPFFLHIVPQKQVIGINEAREIAGFLKLKTTGASAIRRLVLIEHADAMTIEAQNALLKSIEEPPADTVVLLTLNSRTGVLPTVLSRLQVVAVRTPVADALKRHLVHEGYSETEVEKTLLLCDGLPGLVTALLRGDGSSEFVEAIGTAKKLLSADAFTRLTMVDEIVSNKQTERVVEAVMYIAQAALLAGSGKSGTQAVAKKWTQVATRANLAAEQLRASAQAKLVLANLCMHI